MSLLAGSAYDPSTAVTKSCASLLAMTAIDTTNLRLTFTAPANGTVLVKLRGVLHGATTVSQILLGVLDGATVRGRAVPLAGRTSSGGVATTAFACDAQFIVTGLTPGNSYTWDAAYGVEVVATSSDLKYGGPDDATANNAFGSFQFEVWETANLLAGVHYDPATAVAQTCVAPVFAMTAFDTTNLRLAFTAPASGNVLVRLRTNLGGNTTAPNILLGVLDGATVRMRVAPVGGPNDMAAQIAAQRLCYEGLAVVTGLTPGNSYTWDAAYGLEGGVSSTNIHYGGPNNTTANDAWGGFSYEVWAA